MAMISMWTGWLVAGRALRPLRAITTTARDISANSLHERLALTGPNDEIKQLGRTFDRLLDRLETAFETQRRFVANASHELRTPLAYERGLVEVALADPDVSAETLLVMSEEVLAIIDQQEQLIEGLLTLSRSERGFERREPVDLATLAAAALTARHNGLLLETSLEPAVATGDPSLIERLVANLVSNAITHNVSPGRIFVSTTTSKGRALLTIMNTGPPVPANELDRLFQPFQRLAANRTDPDGAGLGLSIVQAIATAHNANVTAAPHADGGLHIEVDFPNDREHDDPCTKIELSPRQKTSLASPDETRPTIFGYRPKPVTASFRRT